MAHELGPWAVYVVTLSRALGEEWQEDPWVGPTAGQVDRATDLFDVTAAHITELVDAGLQDPDEDGLAVYRAKLEQVATLGHRILEGIPAGEIEEARVMFMTAAEGVAHFGVPVHPTVVPAPAGTTS